MVRQFHQIIVVKTYLSTFPLEKQIY